MEQGHRRYDQLAFRETILTKEPSAICISHKMKKPTKMFEEKVVGEKERLLVTSDFDRKDNFSQMVQIFERSH